MMRETQAQDTVPATGDYPFRGDILRLLSHTHVFLASLEQMESVPVGPHFSEMLNQVCLGMDQVAVATNGVVDYLASANELADVPKFEVWSLALAADLGTLLGAVQRVREKVDHFALLLMRNSAPVGLHA